jgi:hypothetical protein
MPSTLRKIDGDPPIAPDIVPADWADCVPTKPASDAISREKLFAEIRHAAETVAPKVDNTFRATDVNDIPALDSSSRAWIRRAGTVFVFALISVVAAALWKHHGDTARETVAGWVPLSLASSSPAAEPSAEPAGQPAAEQQTVAAQPPAAEATSRTATGFPPEADQQIQSLTRDLADKAQQIEQLKVQIEALKANQQVAVAPAAPVARAPTPKPHLPKVTALPPRPVPVAPPPRPAYQPATQAAVAAPPAATAPPPAYPPPPQAYPPPQPTTQPNGEPIVRPPMPLPLSDRY